MSHNRETLNRIFAIIEEYRLDVSNKVRRRLARDYKTAPPPELGEFLLPSINIGKQSHLALETLCGILAVEVEKAGLTFDPLIYDFWVKALADEPYDSVMNCRVCHPSKGLLKRNRLLQETLWWLILEPARCRYIGDEGLVLPGLRCSQKPVGEGGHTQYGVVIRQKDDNVFLEAVKDAEISRSALIVYSI